MALILSIDTATDTASVSIDLDGKNVGFAENQNQREHASFVHVAVADVVKQAATTLAEVDAFAVTSGPGSYTGLRVGMATVKGFCYAFSKPLIAINTLEVMTKAAMQTVVETADNILYCPMIDARRMEVFAALYDQSGAAIVEPAPFILDESFFNSYMTDKKVHFFGSGSEKLKDLITRENASFPAIIHNAKHLAMLADQAFQQQKFADVSYSEPNYLKDFYVIGKK